MKPSPVAADQAMSPVSPEPMPQAEESSGQPEEGIGLCLSGGGYRAMVFHVGVILRLNELKLLPKLSRISSVSGGSMTAGVLGMNWKNLAFVDGQAANLEKFLVEPIRKMAATTIDRGAILGGIFLPGTISDFVIGELNSILFEGATLQALPADRDDPAASDDEKGPRFVINATSVQTGSLVRFTRRYVADYRVGMIENPQITLAQAVAASAAFPPVLSPCTIEIEPEDYSSQYRGDLFEELFDKELVLTDGGVYDNLGLETVWKNYQSVLVSDAGGAFNPDPDPASNWAEHSRRVIDLVDNQVRSLRKRQLITSYVDRQRTGTYWGIRTDIRDYNLADALACPYAETLALAGTPTRLRHLNRSQQDRLMNWGYAVCDAALRKHFADHLPEPIKPPMFPCLHGVG